MSELEALLTELDRLHAASTQGEFRYWIRDGDIYFDKENLAFIAALHNSYPDLARRLREAESQRDDISKRAVDTIQELTAQRDAETRRLDWLEKDLPLSIIRYREKDMAEPVIEVGDINGQGKTLRQAIDAAIAHALKENHEQAK